MLLGSLTVTDDQLRHLDLAEGEHVLRDGIMSRSDDEALAVPLEAAAPTRARRRLSVFGTAAAAVMAIVIAIVQPFAGSNGAWADALVAAAEASPLVLLTEAGWEVTRADIYGDEGEMTFAGNGRVLDLHWRAEDYDGFVDDRAADADLREELTLLGAPATMLRYRDANVTDEQRREHDLTTLVRDRDYTLEIRGAFGSIDEYRHILDSLRRVDVDTWLSAMPASVIQAADRAPVVRAMLADIPLPDGFDPTTLETGTLADRYQLGAQVTGAVSCARLELWLDATARGDASAADQAADALATSRDWAILQELDPQGGWSSQVWAHADAVTADGLVHGVWTVRESYGDALDCTS